MKEPIPIEHAKVFIQPQAGAQGLPVVVLQFPNGQVIFELTESKRARIRTLNKTAEKAKAQS